MITPEARAGETPEKGGDMHGQAAVESPLTHRRLAAASKAGDQLGVLD